MAGIIISSSVGWTASGKIDGGGPRIVVPLEFTIPLKRRLQEPNAAGGQVTLIVVVLPSGNNSPTTVNPSDIPLDEFKDFPFRPLILFLPSVEEVALVATYAQGSNSTKTPSQPVVVSGTEVTVKSDGQTTVPVKLSIEWIWKVRCQGSLIGVLFDLVVPLKLDGDSYEGWETPVNLELKLSNGTVVTQTVEPKDIPLRSFKGFNLRFPERADELELTVTARQTGGAGSVLIVGDVYYPPLRT